MAGRVYNNTAYALGQSPLVGMAPSPIPSKRNPNTSDFAPIGQIWVNTLTNTTYILTSVVNNSANWSAIGGSSASFTNLSVSGTLTLPGGVTVTSVVPTVATVTGSIQTTGGFITQSINCTSITGTGNWTTSGLITSSAGNIIATTGYITGASVATTGDKGSIAGGITLTNVTNESLAAGTVTFNTTTANNSTNTGWMKIYVDADVRYIPYVTNIAP